MTKFLYIINYWVQRWSFYKSHINSNIVTIWTKIPVGSRHGSKDVFYYVIHFKPQYEDMINSFF